MNNTFCLLIWVFYLSIHTLSAQTYKVNSTLDVDDGVCNAQHCSLREAIHAANADAGASLIEFDLSGNPPFILQLSAPLPNLTGTGTILDGSTQPGFMPGDIVLDGSLIPGENENGLVIRGNDIEVYGLYLRNFSLHGISIGPNQNIQIGSLDNKRRNIVSNNGASGIFVESGTNNISIEGNYVGGGVDGRTLMPNGSGIYFNANGSTTSGVRIQSNLISGNQDDGIFGQSLTDVFIGSNRIGVNISGTEAMSNGGNGIQLVNCSLVQIGDSVARNIISGNKGAGILLSSSDAQNWYNITIQNNYIGLSETGDAALANSLDGIEIRDLAGIQIGGETSSTANVISGNRLMGIRATRSSDLAVLNNLIGSNASGLTPVPNGNNGVNLTDCIKIQVGKPGAGNLISGNREDGILIARNDLGRSVDRIQIQSNRIGVNRLGSQTMGNGSAGIQCHQIESGLVIGGSSPGQGNVIGGNNRGIWLNNCRGLRVEGNYVGVGVNPSVNLGNRIAGIALINAQQIEIGGSSSAANTIAYNREGVWIGPNSRFCKISQNSFFCNLISGIYITEGSNNNVGAPAFICAFPDEITGISPPRAVVEIYKNNELCADLACQGRSFIGAIQADDRGVWSLPGDFQLGAVYTATATDVNNNTSIFLECVPARLRPQATAGNTGPYCEGSTIQLLGKANMAGATYSWTGPNGFFSTQQNPGNAVAEGVYILTIEQGGCPSAPDTTYIAFTENVTIDIGDEPDEWLCSGQSIEINGNRYDEQNKTGREQIIGKNGACDTIYNINLRFFTPAVLRIDSTLCTGEYLRINGEVFDESRSSGMTVLPGMGQNGCDSLIMVELSFYEPAVSRIDTTLCRGSSFIFNGEIYDENRPTGIVVVPGASTAGCDSLINIQVNFYPPASLDIDTILCRDDQLVVNGRLYNWNHPTGTEILRGAAARGCDSLINVRLRFFEPSVNRIDTILCRGSSFTYNDILYDEDNPTGMETLPGGSMQGCDSIILIHIQYVDPLEITLDTTLCKGQSITVQGRRYDEINPAGIETLPGQKGQCDTLLHINLRFISEVVQVLNPTLCEGERLLVNGRYYDALNPSGIERIPGGSIMGCDSIVEVSLNFVRASTLILEEQLCPGDFLEVNGIRYDENHPSGIDTIVGGAANGCDSIVMVSLSFVGLEARLLNESPGCLPGNQGALVIVDIPVGTAPFSYRLDNKDDLPITTLPFRIDKLKPGMYQLTITDANGCMAEFKEIIPAPVGLTVDLGPDLLIKAGDSIQLVASSSGLPAQIQWKPAEGLSCSTCLSPVASPLRTTLYTLTISNTEGCTASDYVRVEVVEPQGYFVPNAFSPNNDGENDLLIIFADPAKITLLRTFQIYDRWGNLLFERKDFHPNDENSGWDGRVKNGSFAPVGSYIYVLELQLNDGESVLENGVVYLVR